MPKLSIRDIDLANKRVFIRVDFNVPLTEDGSTITDDTRIVATLPTIVYALQHKAKVILASHLGRPKGKPNPKYSLRPVVDRLRELLDKELGERSTWPLPPTASAKWPSKMARQLESGQVLLLENLRFHAEEEANDPAFSKALASLAEVYVNDAFGSAHRAHASTEGITHFLNPAVAGLLMEKEITYLGKALEAPEKPFVAIIGGSKISGKIDVIEQSARQGRYAGHRRRHGLHIRPRPRRFHRQVTGRRRQDRYGQSRSRQGQSQGRPAFAPRR